MSVNDALLADLLRQAGHPEAAAAVERGAAQPANDTTAASPEQPANPPTPAARPPSEGEQFLAQAKGRLEGQRANTGPIIASPQQEAEAWRQAAGHATWDAIKRARGES